MALAFLSQMRDVNSVQIDFDTSDGESLVHYSVFHSEEMLLWVLMRLTGH